jgi:hypothetical protein
MPSPLLKDRELEHFMIKLWFTIPRRSTIVAVGTPQRSATKAGLAKPRPDVVANANKPFATELVKEGKHSLRLWALFLEHGHSPTSPRLAVNIHFVVCGTSTMSRTFELTVPGCSNGSTYRHSGRSGACASVVFSHFSAVSEIIPSSTMFEKA